MEYSQATYARSHELSAKLSDRERDPSNSASPADPFRTALPKMDLKRKPVVRAGIRLLVSSSNADSTGITGEFAGSINYRGHQLAQRDEELASYREGSLSEGFAEGFPRRFSAHSRCSVLMILVFGESGDFVEKYSSSKLLSSFARDSSVNDNQFVARVPTAINHPANVRN